jgi:rare lipoprotein A
MRCVPRSHLYSTAGAFFATNAAVPKRLLPCLLAGLALLVLAGCGTTSVHGYRYRPYTVHGEYYVPMHPREALGYTEYGTASCYMEGFFIFPGKTATGENIFPWTKCAAHKTLPLPCRVRITNLENGRHVVVRVNDRGPFVHGRIIDVTNPVAVRLGFFMKGTAQVKIEVISVGDGRYRIR